MAKELRYKLINTTIKPLLRDKRTGKDLRTAVEKVGHPVQFRDKKDNVIAIPAGRHRIVEESEITGGILGLKRGGFIDIQSIKSIGDALKEYSLQDGETAPQRG